MDITIDRPNQSKDLAGHLISGILQDSINLLCMTLPSIKDIQSFFAGTTKFQLVSRAKGGNGLGSSFGTFFSWNQCLALIPCFNFQPVSFYM